MKQILGSVLLFSALLNAGMVEAVVDSNEVFPGDSVVLTITVVGEDIKSLPNISSVGGVGVINSSRRSSSSFSSVNGKAKMEVTESLMLEFVPEQNMTIPSFQVKVDGKIESSKPIKISVNPKKNRTTTSENFALDMELSKTEAFVGEPIVATVKFRHKRNINLLNIEYQEPKFEGFFSKMIGKQRNYNKGNYAYMELQYLLIAKQDGDVRIDPARAKIAIGTGRRGLWFTDRAKWSSLISASPLVNIKKPDGNFDIVGSYSLDDNVDTTEVEANKPVNLKIVLDGEGSLDDYEGLLFELSGVTLYSDDAKIDNKLVGDKLHSRYTKQFVFISDHDFTIPSRTIRAYNYKTGEINELKTKEYKIKVKGASKEAITSTVYTKNRIDNNKSKQDTTHTVSWQVPSWFMLLGAFLFGVVATIVGQRYLPSVTFGKFRMSRDEALSILYPKIGESIEVEEMVRKLYDARQGKKVSIDKRELKRLVEKYSD